MNLRNLNLFYLKKDKIACNIWQSGDYSLILRRNLLNGSLGSI